MVAKTLGLFVFVYWLRWSLLRFRSDQLMRLCWRYLVPGSVALVAVTAAWVLWVK
jgi:NADH-quinone oxidoreductase subunit H